MGNMNTASTSIAGSAAPSPLSELDSRFQRLGNAVDQLSGHLNDLSARIAPVLRQPEDKKVGNASEIASLPPGACGYSNSLINMENYVSDIDSVVLDLLDRLAI